LTESKHPRREYVSTGHLPPARRVRALVDEAYRLYRADTSGTASQTYPALARVPGDLFGICVAGIDGSVRGQLAARHLSRALGSSLFASQPRHAFPSAG
jgi:hypothetical protein